MNILAKRREWQDLPVSAEIGKNAVTDAVLKELDDQLERKARLKVRFKRGALSQLDKGEEAGSIAAKLKATLIDLRGNTIVLYRKKGQKVF